jgi:hypothetical protein
MVYVITHYVEHKLQFFSRSLYIMSENFYQEVLKNPDMSFIRASGQESCVHAQFCPKECLHQVTGYAELRCTVEPSEAYKVDCSNDTWVDMDRKGTDTVLDNSLPRKVLVIVGEYAPPVEQYFATRFYVIDTSLIKDIGVINLTHTSKMYDLLNRGEIELLPSTTFIRKLPSIKDVLQWPHSVATPSLWYVVTCMKS